MDRRTGLAFVLIFLILFGSQYLLPKFFPRQSQETQTETLDDSHGSTSDNSQESTPSPTKNDPVIDDSRSDNSDAGLDQEFSTAGIESVDQALAMKPGLVEKQLKVTTPLYQLILSSEGGRIISFQTLKHKYHAGGYVELVPEFIPDSGLDALIFRNGEMDLGKANFQFVQSGEIVLMEGMDPVSVDMVAETRGGLTVHKILTFNAETYGMDLDYFLTAAEGELSRQSLNLLGSPEDFRFSWNQGITMTERIEKMEKPAMRSLSYVGDQLETKKRDGLKKDLEKVTGTYHGSVHYAAVQNKYFTVFGIVPQGENEAIEGTIRLSGDQKLNAQSWAIDVPAERGSGSEIAKASLQLFIGPADRELVAGYGQNIDKAIDLGMRIIRPLSSLVLALMSWLHLYIPNYGVIIILFSVATKLAFYPLSKAQTNSMKRMQEIQPKIKELQAKYKDDKDKLNQATMKLYQEEKVNPLAGCLPMLVQMPVFFALYQALNHTIALRGQPFFGWITDLSEPDSLYSFGGDGIILLGSDLNLLPILMSVAMYFQTKLTPSTGGGQMAAMNTMLPLVMVFIFYSMPSGLVLYWLVNTLMQVYQSWRIQAQATPEQGVQSA